MSWLFGKPKAESAPPAPAPVSRAAPPPRGPAVAVKPPASQMQEFLGLQAQARQKADQDKARVTALVIDVKAAIAKNDITGALG